MTGRGHILGALALLASAGLCPAPVAAQEPSAEALRARLGALAEELSAMRTELGSGSAARAAQRAPAGGGDLSLRLDRLELELSRLTGLVEELAYRQRLIAEDGARRLGDLEFRITELEGGDIAALRPQPPLGGVGGQDAAPGQPAPTPPESSEPAPPVPAPDATPSAARTDLELAIADVRQGRFDQGEERLERYLATVPPPAEASEALYWLGTSEATRGQHQSAARRFLGGYNADRRGAFAARNLLQLGVTLGKLGQVQDACLTLREVRSQFPDAPRDLLGAADAEADRLACSS